MASSFEMTGSGEVSASKVFGHDAVERSAEEGNASRKNAQVSLPLLPILLGLTLWLGLSWLVVGAAISPKLPGGWTLIGAALTLSALPVWRLALGFRGLAYPSAATRLLMMRPFWYSMLAMPLLAVATTAGAALGLPFGAAGVGARGMLLATAGVLSAMAVAGYVGSRRLTRRHLDVVMPRLPHAFDGLRIVQLSDLHVGPHTPTAFLARIAEAVRDEAPDLIVFTGDQVDDFADDVVPFVNAFGTLRAPLGVFAVAGNHDVYAGWAAVRRGLEHAGMTVLVNENAPVTRGGSRLWIAGTGDPAARGGSSAEASSAAPDVAGTLDGIPATEPVVVLAHNPALWPALAERGADLTLSGHTHYGQLAVPSRKWSLASSFLQLAMGAHRVGRSLLYINPGTNYWGIPFRLGTPPEVTVLTLRAGAQAEVVEPAVRAA